VQYELGFVGMMARLFSKNLLSRNLLSKPETFLPALVLRLASRREPRLLVAVSAPLWFLSRFADAPSDVVPWPSSV
jgi:hypothetical protein